MTSRFAANLFLLVPGACCIISISSCLQKQSSAASVFCYNESSGIPTLDPAFAKNLAVMWPVHQLFNTLVEIDDDLHLIPSLARSWEAAPDGLSYTFHLRTDVRFHDDACFPGGVGRKLTASDVVYSFSRILDPATASPGSWVFNGRVDPVNPFEAPDDSTFRIRLQSPFRPLPGILSMPYCSVIPREAPDFYRADWRRHPVGSGPFMFCSWEEGQALILKRNPKYFEKDDSGNPLPYLEGIKISFLDSKATEFLEFRQGRLDLVNDVDPSFKDELLTRKGGLRKSWEGKLQLMKCPYLNVEYLGMLADSGLAGSKWTGNKFFRKALTAAIDRRKLVFFLRNSIGIPADAGFVPPPLASWHDDSHHADYAEGLIRNWLIAAGYHFGQEEPLVLCTVPAYAHLATYIVSEWNLHGIRARVEVMQKSLLLDQMAAGKIALFRGSWIADYPDAENYFSVFYGGNPAPPNYTRFRNKLYDSLYERSVAEKNDSIRLNCHAAMDSVIFEDCPVIPLWYDEVLNLLQPGIEGYHPNPRNMLELRKVRKMRKKSK